MKPVLYALLILLTSCGPHIINRVKPEPPHVWLTLSTTHAVCADPPRQHYEFGDKQHKHVVVFATAFGDVKPDDVIVVTITGRPTRLRAAGGTVTVHFPAGIGDHEITADWTDASSVVKRSAKTVLHVFEWALCEPEAQAR